MVSMDTSVKLIGDKYPIFQLLFLNSLFSLLPISFFVIKNHGLVFLKKQNFKFQIVRGFLHAGGFLFVLSGVTKIPLSVVYPVLFSSPLILLVLSHFFLKDNINSIRVIALIIGFTGIIISSEPFGTNSISFLGVFEVFIGAVFIAITNLITRKYEHLASSYETSFFSMFISVLIFFLIMSSNFILMPLNDMIISVIGGLCAGFGVSAIIFGARTLPASIFGTTSYFQLAYGVILGWLFFNQLPTNENLLGILFVIIAGGILFFFDKQSKISP
ncbi:MAG: hypothetical protein CMI90_02455 [Pelagibacteraceae bacterium]|nr:hypothetical protein [Pelagibacteraceae bacterium]